MTNRSGHSRQRLIDRLLDLEVSDNPVLANFLRDVNELEEDQRFYWLTFHIDHIGPWKQRDDEICLSDAWCKVFGINDSPRTLQGYVKLIDDVEEHRRIYESRLNLQQQAVGTRWESEYTLCGRKIRSIGFVCPDGFIAGLDMILHHRDGEKK